MRPPAAGLLSQRYVHSVSHAVVVSTAERIGLLIFTAPPTGERGVLRVCLSVLSTKSLCMLPVPVARSSSEGVVIRYVFPVCIQLKKLVRYENRCYSDVLSKAYMSRINLQHRTTTVGNKKTIK